MDILFANPASVISTHIDYNCTCRWCTSYLLQSKFICQTLEDFAAMAGIEYVCINKDTTINNLKNELRWNDVFYNLNNK
jgi:hypothetical protein